MARERTAASASEPAVNGAISVGAEEETFVFAPAVSCGTDCWAPSANSPIDCFPQHHHHRLDHPASESVELADAFSAFVPPPRGFGGLVVVVVAAAAVGVQGAGDGCVDACSNHSLLLQDSAHHVD